MVPRGPSGRCRTRRGTVLPLRDLTPERRHGRPAERIPGALAAVLAALLLAAPPPAAAEGRDAAARLPPPVVRVLERYRIPADSLSVFVQAVDQPRPLIAFHADVARNPASTMKLVTTFAALDMLGPVYEWKTEAWVTGPLRGGTLEGDLVIKGYGDPYLVPEQVWKFVRALRHAGIEHVAGDLVADKSHFDIAPDDPGEFDGRPYRAYNAPPDALLVNYQATSFLFFPDRERGRVRIVPEPAASTVEVENAVKLVNGACNDRQYRIAMDVRDGGGRERIRFSGTYPVSCGSHAITRRVADPATFGLGVFGAMWAEAGGTVAGELRIGTAPEGARRVHTMHSRPLAELIRSMNKFSNNVMTRQLLLTLGAERFGPPGSLAKGRDAIRAWLRARRLEAPELVLDNGAGLSRDARISSRTLGRLLLLAWRHPYMPEFVSSLAISGMDGTLERRFRDEPLGGRVHLKTGSINDVKAMAGYLHTPKGENLVVVTLHNHRGIHWGRGEEVQQALLEWLARR